MFNGIIYQQGTVSKFSKLNAGTKIYIKSKLKLDKKDIGSSIACDGVCLTLVSKKKDLLANKSFFFETNVRQTPSHAMDEPISFLSNLSLLFIYIFVPAFNFENFDTVPC